MKSIFPLLLVILCGSARAEIVVEETRNFSPPTDWQLQDFSSEPWWPAFMAEMRPETLSFEEWRKCYSKNFLTKNSVTAEGLGLPRKNGH
jgi:hypothetical protein